MTIKKYINECPNHFRGREGNIPDVIVLHNTGGTKISSAHWWFLDAASKTSAHFLIGLDGEIRQYVNIADGSYCNGTTNDRTKPHYYGNATSGVVKTRPQNANLYTVSIECVGNVGDALTDAQFQAVVALIRHIRSEVKKIYLKDIPLNRLHIIGHYEVAPLTREYCGVNLPYDRILKELKGLTVEEVRHKAEVKPEENPKTSDVPETAEDVKKPKKTTRKKIYKPELR